MADALTFAVPLFVPGNRPERFAKAAASGADAIVLDLEDAVSPDLKDAARAALDISFTDLPVIVRVNGPGTPWHLFAGFRPDAAEIVWAQRVLEAGEGGAIAVDGALVDEPVRIRARTILKLAGLVKSELAPA